MENSRKYKLLYSDRKQISVCLKKEGQREHITKGHKDTFGVIDTVTILSIVMSWVYGYIQTSKYTLQIRESIVCQ